MDCCRKPKVNIYWKMGLLINILFMLNNNRLFIRDSIIILATVNFCYNLKPIKTKVSKKSNWLPDLHQMNQLEEIGCKCSTFHEGTTAVEQGVVRHALLVSFASNWSCINRVDLQF